MEVKRKKELMSIIAKDGDEKQMKNLEELIHSKIKEGGRKRRKQ
jgi:hypothetical protein